jgi:HlyD family secretion protein
MKKRSYKKWIVLLILLGAIGATVAIALKPKPKGIEVTFGDVSRGDITSTVSATGRIFPQMEVKISSEVPGEIVELPVKDGTVVERGQLLVRVNPDTLEAQVKQREASLSATRASSAQNLAQKLQAQLDLQRLEDLFSKGFATAEQVEQSQTLVQVREASYNASVFQIERQQMELEESRKQLGKASLFSPIDGTIVRLSAELGDRVVGTGQFAGTEIMRVANLERIEVRIDVSEADIVNVAVGQPAKVEVDAIPNETFSGRVAEIALSAQTSGGGGQEQLTTFLVRVLLDAPNPRIRPGMTATAEIETATVTDVVKVPMLSVVVRPAREVREALDPKPEGDAAAKDGTEPAAASGRPTAGQGGPREGGGRPGGGRDAERTQRVVFVVAGDTVELRPVETGIADKNHIEIKSGLADGDKVVTGSYRALTRELKHGSAVREAVARSGERGRGDSNSNGRP